MRGSKPRLSLKLVRINMLNKYDAMLKGVREFDNYWSDVGMTDAIALLEDFSDEDWEGLGKLVAERPSLWQVSCAETLSEVTNTERSFSLLLRLLQTGDEDVIVAALDSINALASYGLDVTSKATQLRHAIGTARINAGAAVSRMLDALEKKLPPV